MLKGQFSQKDYTMYTGWKLYTKIVSSGVTAHSQSFTDFPTHSASASEPCAWEHLIQFIDSVHKVRYSSQALSRDYKLHQTWRCFISSSHLLAIYMVIWWSCQKNLPIFQKFWGLSTCCLAYFKQYCMLFCGIAAMTAFSWQLNLSACYCSFLLWIFFLLVVAWNSNCPFLYQSLNTEYDACNVFPKKQMTGKLVECSKNNCLQHFTGKQVNW